MRQSRSRALHAALKLALGAGIATAALGGTEGSAAAHGHRDHRDPPNGARETSKFGFDIDTVSTRADMVTGGDVLVRIDTPSYWPQRWVTVELNGDDVTDAFHDDPYAPGRSKIGQLTGLREGTNRIAVYANKWGIGGTVAKLEVTNYPITGNVFSGEPQEPFYCETQNFRLPDGTSLGPALDSNCSIATRVDYFYRTTSPTSPSALFKRLANKNDRPSDLATTTTTSGAVVPYIIRMETGTVNRAVYQTTVLEDPGVDSEPDPWHRTRGWNGRLVYTFGGGCINGWYRQGSSTGGVMDDNILRQGYAMASATLNVYGNNCQDVTSAETMMMVKERFIEAYGDPVATMGWGCSGGSYQQHQIGDNYPGLLDGIIPGCSFPEVMFGTIHMISDARLLNHYFKDTNPSAFSAEQQRAVTGFLVLNTMPNVSVGAGRITPFEFCPAVLPVSERYHPLTNPGGVRCDVYDHTVNVLGIDETTGFARRPLDNVGIQYGLAALNDGVITVDQFLDLNERIGGYDKDAQYQGDRNEATRESIDIGYRSGRMTYGGLGLRDIPIIDYRAYNDDAPGGDIHVRYHSFSMRERLLKANGTYDNQVMLVEDMRYGLYSSASPMLLHALAQLDKWIANIDADDSRDPRWVKVIRNKPDTLVEGCNTRDASPTFIAEEQILREGQCEELYPSAPAPREVAGADVASDIIKCRLKRVDMDDYAVPFTKAQKNRLRAIFSDGVCDWSKPGVGQRRPAGTWQRF